MSTINGENLVNDLYAVAEDLISRTSFENARNMKCLSAKTIISDNEFIVTSAYYDYIDGEIADLWVDFSYYREDECKGGECGLALDSNSIKYAAKQILEIMED